MTEFSKRQNGAVTGETAPPEAGALCADGRRAWPGTALRRHSALAAPGLKPPETAVRALGPPWP